MLGIGVAGQVLQSNGSAAPSWIPFGARFAPFKTSGTWVCPSGVTLVWATGVGAGGGGGGDNTGTHIGIQYGGGGKGQPCISVPITVVPGRTYNIAVGSGGLGGVSAGNTGSSSGTNGGATTLVDSTNSSVLLNLAGGGGGTQTTQGVGYPTAIAGQGGGEYGAPPNPNGVSTPVLPYMANSGCGGGGAHIWANAPYYGGNGSDGYLQLEW